MSLVAGCFSAVNDADFLAASNAEFTFPSRYRLWIFREILDFLPPLKYQVVFQFSLDLVRISIANIWQTWNLQECCESTVPAMIRAHLRIIFIHVSDSPSSPSSEQPVHNWEISWCSQTRSQWPAKRRRTLTHDRNRTAVEHRLHPTRLKYVSSSFPHSPFYYTPSTRFS